MQIARQSLEIFRVSCSGVRPLFLSHYPRTAASNFCTATDAANISEEPNVAESSQSQESSSVTESGAGLSGPSSERAANSGAPGGFKKRQRRVSKTKKVQLPVEFRTLYPDFMPRPEPGIRHSIAEKLERLDMLRRREVIEIPEFYAGSIMAVKVSDPHAPGRTNRFVGICILRQKQGLRYTFTLRNVIDGFGFEVRYDAYNPLIQEIQVLKLEKRLDDNLLYLRDAPPEYSTIPWNMEPVPHPPDAPVPINTLQVKLRRWAFWHQKWHMKQDLRGIERPLIDQISPWAMRKFVRKNVPHWERLDIMKNYRENFPAEDQAEIYEEIDAADKSFMASKASARRRFLIPRRMAPDPSVTIHADGKPMLVQEVEIPKPSIG